MQDYTMNDAEETLSLSNFLMDDDSEQLSKLKHSSMSSSSSSEPDFVGFFSEEWSNTSYSNSAETIVFCGKVVSPAQTIAGDRKPGSKSQTNPLFRSNSESFSFIRMKRGIPSRSKSFPSRSACKSRLMVFMFGSGSSKFPTKVDMNDIKSRQLRQPWAASKEESDGRNKGWWRLVDVLGCGGGYERDTVGVI